MFTETSPELILDAYRQGIFPMADSAASPFYDFYRPVMRGQLSIQDLHIPRRLLKTIRKNPYRISVDTDFENVIEGCRRIKKGRESTWINKPIKEMFLNLHKKGYAHSVECWQNDNLVGGLYGLAIGAVFCGESMFSVATDASKIALVYLCAHLDAAGFTVLDTQFTNEHLEQFGVYEIPQEEYEALIKTEMNLKRHFRIDKNPDDILSAYLDKKYQP
jgi:leucyl/phenylalanyl-tRNA--protein transferase